MTRQAAEYGLVFEEPPAPRRAPAATRAGARPPLEVVRSPRPVAPDSRRAHGTYVKYVVERCGCEPCRLANRAYENRRQHAIRRPDEVWLPYVPAGPARRHLRALAAVGVGPKTVAKISGVPHGSLAKIVYGDPKRGMGPSKRIRPATSARILAVTVADAAGAQKVPAGPTWVLLDDLIARGYTRQFLGRALGSTAKVPSLQVRHDLVRASTARKVEQIHRRLQGRPGPGKRSRWSK